MDIQCILCACVNLRREKIVLPLSDQLLARNGPKPAAGRILSKDSGFGRTNWSMGRGRRGVELQVNRLDSSFNVYLKDIFNAKCFFLPRYFRILRDIFHCPLIFSGLASFSHLTMSFSDIFLSSE